MSGKPTQVSFGLRIYPGVMQFQLIFRSARGNTSSYATSDMPEPTVEGQVMADGEIIAIHGSLWKATRLDSHDRRRRRARAHQPAREEIPRRGQVPAWHRREARDHPDPSRARQRSRSRQLAGDRGRRRLCSNDRPDTSERGAQRCVTTGLPDVALDGLIRRSVGSLGGHHLRLEADAPASASPRPNWRAEATRSLQGDVKVEGVDGVDRLWVFRVTLSW